MVGLDEDGFHLTEDVVRSVAGFSYEATQAQRPE